MDKKPPTPPEREREKDNLILFPSAHRYPPQVEEIISDPVEDLLSEFEGHPLWRELEETFATNERERSFATRSHPHYRHWSFQARLKYLRELQERLSFYLTEIELYLPNSSHKPSKKKD